MKSGHIVGGKYRLRQRLGAGAMGAVWEAVNERTGRLVALKLVLHPSDDLRQRLRKEARACGSLAHPNVVEIYDVGETESGEPFLIMELLSGETLGDLLSRKRRIEPALAARIGRDIACALAAAHEAQIIHRDLKPANIFLHRTPSGAGDGFVVKVLDFGVSKNLASTEGPATITGAVLGSPAYMSPEQLRVVKDLDHRTDIWSMGIVLFEMLAGVRPFRGPVEEVVRQILSAPIPPVSSRVRSIDPALDAIVGGCLERDRDRRIPTATDLARMLDGHAQAGSTLRIQMGPAPPPSDSGRTVIGLGAPLEIAHDDDDIATLPIQKRTLAAMANSAAPSAIAAPEADTRILPPAESVASALPAWRLEMQRTLAASRLSTATGSEAQPADGTQSGTVGLALPELEAAEPSRATAMASLAPMAIADGAQDAPRSEPPASRARGKKRESVLLLASVGVGLAVLTFAAVYIGMRAPTEQGSAPQPMVERQLARAPQIEVPAASAATPIMTKPVVLEKPEPTVNPLAPKATAPTSAPPATSNPPRTPSARGASLPPCGVFISKNCKPVNPYAGKSR
ncbi:serine/threonine-protein kinase [Polyangium aurulentum]|uniref:serine/threonine-protein kinase n=1 Tax=Polyangium aurulentum TaxID=2567896 RepID=UPI00146E6CA0|nr:protein kinase [Polyangium aurulentum]